MDHFRCKQCDALVYTGNVIVRKVGLCVRCFLLREQDRLALKEHIREAHGSPDSSERH